MKINDTLVKTQAVSGIVLLTLHSGTLPVYAKEASTPTPATNTFGNLFQGGDTVPDIPSNPSNQLFDNDTQTTMNSVQNGTYGILQQAIPVVIALCFVWLVTSFVIFASQLAQHGDNPQLRHEVYHNLYRNLIAVAIVGGAASIAALFVGAGHSLSF